KPHSDSFVLIVFETEIIVWFYVEARFCPASFIVGEREENSLLIRLI
ncbi:hypothetical protein JOC28_002052, partial [Streptococcus loxodontisalivarius]|nr:hypothetical protein [Streptococcus loxodontisalivarius]